MITRGSPLPGPGVSSGRPDQGSPMDLAEAERFLSDVDTVECCFPDTWGVFVGRRMPTAVFLRSVERGISWPNAPFAWNIRGDIDPVPYTNADTGFPNMHVVPDLASLRTAAWADRTAFCLLDAYLEPGGEPHPLDTRAICRRAAETLGAAGYEAWVAPELEFYLTTADWEPLYDDHRCWSMTLGAEHEADPRGDPLHAVGRRRPRRVEPDRRRARTVGGERRPGLAGRGGRQRSDPEVRGQGGRQAARCAGDLHADALPRRRGQRPPPARKPARRGLDGERLRRGSRRARCLPRRSRSSTWPTSPR